MGEHIIASRIVDSAHGHNWFHVSGPGADDVAVATAGPFTLYAHIDGSGLGSSTIQHVLTCSTTGWANDYDGEAGEGTEAFVFDGENSVVIGDTAAWESNDRDYAGPFDGTFSAMSGDFSTWITGLMTTSVIGGSSEVPAFIWVGRIWVVQRQED